MAQANLTLLTGATGYIGGRLLTLLTAEGWAVRCLARQPENPLPRVPAGVEVVRGDLLDAESLRSALVGVEAAFYLVHSMGAIGNFEEHDRLAAENFGQAARDAGSSESSIWAASVTRNTNCRHTFEVGTRSENVCGRPACP